MRRTKSPVEDMARKLEIFAREATSHRLWKLVQSWCGCRLQSLWWKIGVAREQRVVFVVNPG